MFVVKAHVDLRGNGQYEATAMGSTLRWGPYNGAGEAQRAIEVAVGRHLRWTRMNLGGAEHWVGEQYMWGPTDLGADLAMWLDGDFWKEPYPLATTPPTGAIAIWHGQGPAPTYGGAPADQQAYQPAVATSPDIYSMFYGGPAVNGHDAVLFENALADQFLLTTQQGVDQTVGYTISCTAIWLDPGLAADCVLFAGTEFDWYLSFPGGVPSWCVRVVLANLPEVLAVTTLTNPANRHVLTLVQFPASYVGYIDGIQRFGMARFPTGPQNIVISAPSLRSWGGTFYDFVVANVPLTDLQVANLVDYQMTRWGV